LQSKYLGAQSAALASLDSDDAVHLWTALGRCGVELAGLSDAMAKHVLAVEAPSNDLLRTGLVYLQWSASESAQRARHRVADACIQQRVFRFDLDPIYAGRSGKAVDAELTAYLRQNLVGGGGEVRESAAALLAWRYVLGSAEDMSGWQQFLKEKLQEPALAGDVKAGWLLTRAYAEAAGGHWDPMSGQPWVQQAMAAAQSEPLRLQCASMLIKAYMQETDYDRAQSLLASVSPQFSPEGQQELALLGPQIDAARTKTAEALAARQEAVRAAWQTELQRRLAVARQNNDAEAISRYEQLLGSP
jgi:hypothetical protein